MNSIDFYTHLYSKLCEENIEVETNDENKKCLITGEPLEEKCITLTCEHSFNYKNIFKEVDRQKYSVAKTEVQRLKKHEIKCPYCRKIQNGLLPYREGFAKVNMVNHPKKLQMMTNKCQYTFKSGKRKGEFCNKRCVDTLCYTCQRKVEKQKQRQKEREKQKAKKPSQNKVTKHKVNNTHNVSESNVVLCCAILASGKRKGEVCGRHTKNGESKCGFHNK